MEREDEFTRARDAAEQTAAVRKNIEKIIASDLPPWDIKPATLGKNAAELEDALRTLEAKLGEREMALAEAENKLADRDRALSETEALLQARQKVIEAMRHRRPLTESSTPEEIEALSKLKEELDRQEARLKELREAMKEREEFLNQSESSLFEKMQAHMEKETELEQKAEDFKRAIQARGPLTNTSTPAEIEALNKLKQELAKQETILKEHREAMKEREEFLNQSESSLFEKMQAQQEKETELEQKAAALKRSIEARGQSVENEGNIAIDRYIEFPPEYQQAGIGILNYFGRVLQQKYSDQKVAVKISQSDNSVRMTILTADGNRAIVEKAFAEYGLVLQGELPPEQFATTPAMLLELRNELRIANLRVESQKDILKLKDTHIETLMALVNRGLINPQLGTPVEVHVSPTINVTQSTSQNVETNIRELGQALDYLAAIAKDQPDLAVHSERLADVINGQIENPSDTSDRATSLKKVRNFLEKVNDTQSAIRKALDCVDGGIAVVKRIAKAYNKIAPFAGLPQIPGFLVRTPDAGKDINSE